MLESIEDGDETLCSTPEQEQQPKLDPEPEQQPELDPEPEQQPEWKETKTRVGLSVFVIHQKCLHIIHWDSQPSVVSRLVQTLYLNGVIHLPSRPGYYPPPCYGPLVYSPYMHMMYA